MSYDLDFWKYQDGVYLDNQTVYEKACCDGDRVEGLEELPIGQIRQRIADSFADWQRLDGDNYEKKGAGAFTVFTTSQIVRIDCYGLSGFDMNRLIDILLEFDCPLYDPQLPARFDG